MHTRNYHGALTVYGPGKEKHADKGRLHVISLHNDYVVLFSYFCCFPVEHGHRESLSGDVKVIRRDISDYPLTRAKSKISHPSQ